MIDLWSPLAYFTCRFCGREHRLDHMDDPGRPSGRAMCTLCSHGYGRDIFYVHTAATRGDRHFFRRLTAAQAHLDWEIKNGRYRTRPFHAAG